MRYIKHLVRRYPMQSFLILFNAGVFTWLQTTGTMIAYRLDLSGDDIWIYIPTWVNTLTSHSLENIRTLYGASGLTWLMTSMIITWFVTFLKGLMRVKQDYVYKIISNKYLFPFFQKEALGPCQF